MKHSTKYKIQRLLGPFQKKKCPYCLGNFKLFEVRAYHGTKHCPKCGSSLTSEILRLPTMVLAFFPKELGNIFQKRCYTSAFITALLHKKGYVLTPISEKLTLFLVSKKTKKQIKSLCILRCLSFTEKDLEGTFQFKKFIDGLVLFINLPKEEISSSLPKSLRAFLQNVLHSRSKRRKLKKSFPLGVVMASLKGITEYLPQGIAAYTKDPSPEFKGDVRFFSGYIRSLLGFWYGMPLIHTLEKSSPSLFYSALNLEEASDTPSFLSYEVDIISYFLVFWGFKERATIFKNFSLREKSFRIPFEFASFVKKSKKEESFKEKKDPLLRSE